MKNIFFLLCLLVFYCTEKNSNIKCVREGNHLFTPVGLLSPHKPKSFSGYVIFNETALFNSLGEDNKDWNKVFVDGEKKHIFGYKYKRKNK